eukprot:CAMPEP_0172504306 /NCGR_PEP_ID=MMETSP1066-20121228/177416_1 /TAXON_ID=671091 /ORGANISM="Coscinodiscus wailesii, Strain CCMP2513" /LENGTH=208 /DNA_ID=CAMNT_0013280431 /DNA_START=40 /DNA_END=666 /DNA_ORIENTATION=-
MAGQTIEGEIIRELKLDIDTRYASILVTPKPNEVNDANFPRNLHNAAELFLRVGMVENAQRVKETTDLLLDMYGDNPDGRTNFRIGQGCVCWVCGYCGLPKNSTSDSFSSSTSAKSTKKKKDKKKNGPPGPCGRCGETEQINYLRVIRKGLDGKVDDLPWIQAPPLSEEDRRKKDDADKAAKRAEIEANVRKALEERMKADALAKAEN